MVCGFKQARSTPPPPKINPIGRWLSPQRLLNPKPHFLRLRQPSPPHLGGMVLVKELLKAALVVVVAVGLGIVDAANVDDNVEVGQHRRVTRPHHRRVRKLFCRNVCVGVGGRGRGRDDHIRCGYRPVATIDQSSLVTAIKSSPHTGSQQRHRLRTGQAKHSNREALVAVERPGVGANRRCSGHGGSNGGEVMRSEQAKEKWSGRRTTDK